MWLGILIFGNWTRWRFEGVVCTMGGKRSGALGSGALVGLGCTT